MPQPKKKTSRSQRGHRRSHDAVSTAAVVTCAKTGELHRPHRAYKGVDGAYYYKGKAVTAPTPTKEDK